MEINNVFSPVPFYANKRYWHSNKWYTYGQKCPIIMTAEKTLPFQLVVSPGVTLSSFTIKKADNDASVLTVNTVSNYFNIDAETYSIIQVKACTIGALPYGNYYYALTLSDGSTYISDIIAIISDMSKCIKITCKNVENLYFSSGHIDFTNDFVFELYLPTTIGKPEYEYEEELTKRLGYKFVESQVVNKVYKFTFPATEQLCDAYRFVRMCDYIRIDTYNPDFSDYDHYNVIYLSSEVEWLDNGDIASVETSFETDSIVQKLQDYSRTQLVNFYNALLSNSDEVLKFDDETIAQYYSNYIQSIDGKMIRQLNAVSSISDNTVIAIDENNGTGAANKILLKPLLVNTVAEQLQASKVLANFNQHINDSSIHITTAERAVLSLFGVDDNGDVYVKGDKGFYTNSFVSAKGKSSSTGGGSGASALYQLVDVLANSTNDGVQGATTNSVLMYNGTKWYAGTIDAGLDEAALKAYLDANKYTTTAYVDSQVSTINSQISTINSQISAINSQLDTKIDKTDLAKKVDNAFFARVFGLLDANGNEIAINDVATVADSIKAKFGLWTEQYISAKGKNSSGSSTGSASALYQLVDVLANENNDGVQGAITNSVLMYNGTKWCAGTVNTGLDEAALKSYLDANKYTTTTYVDSKISTINSQLDTKADKTALSAYLPLSGGTITGDLTVNGTVYVGTKNYVYHTGNLAGDNAWITLSSDTISHKTIHANNITLIASSGQFVTGYTVDKAGHIVSISQRALNASDIPGIAITQVTGLQDALDKKVDNAFFARVFGLLDSDGNEIAVNDVATVADSIKAKFGLWTEQYISAKGKSSSAGGGGGASALYQLADVVPNSTNDGVLNATNGSVLMYNGSKWQAGNVVTDISPLTLNVNGSSLFTYDGKSSITANLIVPTKVSQLTNDSGYLTAITKTQVEGVLTGNITSHTHDYLPLSGGTLTGKLYSDKDVFLSGIASVLPSHYYHYLWNSSNDVFIHFGNTTDNNKVTYGNFRFYNGEGTFKTLRIGGNGIFTWDGNDVIHAGNYNSYAPTLTGTGASGTWGISITGNAANADKVDGYHASSLMVAVYGSHMDINKIDVPMILRLDISNPNLPSSIFYYGNLLNIKAPGADTAFQLLSSYSSDNFYYRRGTWNSGGTGSLSTNAWKQIAFIDSNVASATKLQTARTITLTGSVTGSVSFDGTSNVSISTSTNHTHYSHVDFSEYTIPANAGVRITYPAVTPVIIGCNRTNGNAQLLLVGSGYGEGGTIRNTFIELIPSGWFSWGVPQSNDISRSIEICNAGGDVAYVRVYCKGDVTFTAITALTSPAANLKVINNSGGTITGNLTVNGTIVGNLSGNATSATKLQTARTLWGQSFNGTANVSGSLSGVSSITASSAVYTGNMLQICRSGNGSSSTEFLRISVSDVAVTFNASDSDGFSRMYFQSNGNNYVAFDGANQRVGIGTTSPVTKLHVVGKTAIYGTFFAGQNTNGTATIDAFSGFAFYGCDAVLDGAIKSSSYIAIHGNTGKVGIGTTNTLVKFNVAGDIAATGAVTAKASSSDIRLKTDISDYKALSIIRSHKSIKYHWNAVAKANADIFNDDYWHYGLIAQDVQRDMPQMVSDVFKDYLVINYERLIPICWKGLQEVDDEVTKLKKKVRKLEMEIRELKQKEDRL